MIEVLKAVSYAFGGLALIVVSFYFTAWFWVIAHRLTHEFCDLFLGGCV